MSGPVVVTGAGGMIGRAVVASLARAGARVVAGYHSKKPSGGPDVVWERLDLLAGGAAQRLAELGPRVVVHCAAVVPPAGDEAAAERAYAANAAMDRLVTTACGTAGVRLVYLSGASVYGLSADLLDEDAPTDPQGPYPRSKLDGERTVREHLDDYAVLRVTAPYGPGQPTRTVLALFVDRALAGRELLYHGSGARCQDFVAVDDVAEAVTRACGARGPGVFNVASGAPINMRDLAALVVETVGSSSGVRPSGRDDPQEHHRARYDVRRIRAALGWQAATDLRAGVARYAATRQAEVAARPAPM